MGFFPVRWPVSVAVWTLLALAIFVLDIMVPLGVATGVLYMVVALVGAGLLLPWSPAFCALLLTLFIGAGWYASPVVAASNTVFITSNRILAIFAVWATVWLVALLRRAWFTQGQATDMLRQSEGRYRALAANLPGGAAFVVNRALRYLLAEGEALTTAGLSSTQMEGKTIWEALEPALARRYEGFYRQALAGEPFVCEHESHGRSYVTRGVPLKDEKGGETYAALAVSYDITERKRAEQALHENEWRLRMATTTAGMFVWECDLATRSIKWSENAAEVIGCRPEELPDETRKAITFISPADARRITREYETAVARGLDHYESQFRGRSDTQKAAYYLAQIRILRDASGAPARAVGVVQDITTRKQAEIALSKSKALLAGQKEAFQTAINGRPLAECLDPLVRTAVWHFDNQARAAFYVLGQGGVTLHHVTGMPADYAREVDGFEVGPESLGCGLAMYLGEPVITPDVEEDPRWRAWAWMARAQDYRGTWSFPVRASDGPVLGSFALYFPEPREPAPEDVEMASTLAHGAAIIISRHKEAADRSRAQQDLKEANRRKDEFLAVLSHELRNPLAPLSTAADLLERARNKPALLDRVQPMLRRQLDHLTRLVDDLLDLSRITRGRVKLQCAALDLREAVEAAVEQNRPLMADRRHELDVHLGDAPLLVDGDFQRLTQVVGNLLSNAIRYSEPGVVITVRAGCEGDAAFVRVKDGGFGIPKERIGELFQMFSQVPEHRALIGGGGLGIGLALSRQLIELHGGSIEATSDGLGRGSEFVVQLPLAPAARDEGQTVTEKRVPGAVRRVLVVDDNADAADSLRMMLELQGHDAQAVYDGPSALAGIEQFAPEIVLLDLRMPKMDGFEVARRIRAMPNGHNLRLVALTGWAQGEDRKRSAEAGFDEHLSKPADLVRLTSLLAEASASGKSVASSPGLAGARPARSRPPSS